jgi:hypothetical protein
VGAAQEKVDIRHVNNARKENEVVNSGK